MSSYHAGMLTMTRGCLRCAPARALGAVRALGVLALLALLVPLRALAGEDYDRWYVVLLNGQRAGWSHNWQVTEGDRITSSTTMSLVLSRGSDTVEFLMETEFVETGRGEPISARSSRAIGSEPVVMGYEWGEGGVRIETVQGGRTTTRTEGAPARGWLPPAAAADFVAARLRAGAETIEYATIDPSSGLRPVVTTMTGFEASTAHLLESTREAVACVITSSAAPGIETRAWLDGAGDAIRSEIPFGGLELTIVLADQATAMQRGEAPELMVDTLVRPDREIESPRRVRDAAYVLWLDGRGALPPIPTTSVQRVEPAGEGRVRVMVDMDAPTPADVADPEVFLASSSMLDTTDPEVVALAERSLSERDRGQVRRAEALRRAVYRHIREKTLGVGFASASEVCRSRAGDCSEHAVLLAALLRTQGIPSRVVSGLVYADSFLGQDGVLAFHMWTQALIEQEGRPMWIDLDATLTPGTPFDATHIALVVSALGDDEGSSDMTAIATLLGRLEVAVEHARP